MSELEIYKIGFWAMIVLVAISRALEMLTSKVLLNAWKKWVNLTDSNETVMNINISQLRKRIKQLEKENE